MTRVSHRAPRAPATSGFVEALTGRSSIPGEPGDAVEGCGTIVR
jgi:hypothetical protein